MISTGDIIFSSDNKIMLNNTFGGNPITYQKRPTEKKYIDTKDLYKADLLSFDSKIGYITNSSSTLWCMLYNYEKGSNVCGIFDNSITNRGCCT